VPIKYQYKDYSIPIIIVITENYPLSGPKVFLAYLIDKESAKANPLLKPGGEVMNKYIHQWDGKNSQYNLGGLILNLSKSFSVYPPFGSASGGMLNTDVIYIADDSTRQLPANVVKEEYKVAPPEEQKVPSHAIADMSKDTAIIEALVKEEEKKNLLKIVTEKLMYKFFTFNLAIKNNIKNGDEEYVAKAKIFLEENHTEIK